ncbi:RHS repeat-associated core domain-containing protein [Pseudomonas sp. FGI182]|uniref:RHS repeat-associated core domain-containing protein n=1 Tax=Pseudomonas sp. FGI182 TaxID=1259844 RepID=UPI002109C91A|nr:RHS repeat-associated core domain-containing protein [Pseudomonas sp. FGI182]
MKETLETITYTPYGYTPSIPLGPGFNGEYRSIFGLYALGKGYRYYSPFLGRFMAPDTFSPFFEGGLNPYAYCQNDPINHLDPSGHVIKKIYNHVSGKYSASTLKRKLESMENLTPTDRPLSKAITFSKNEFKTLENHLTDTVSFSERLKGSIQSKKRRDELKSQSPFSKKDRQAAILKHDSDIYALDLRIASANEYLQHLRQLQHVNIDGKQRFASPKLIRDPSSQSD